MSSQPTSGDQFTSVSAAGSVVISDKGATLQRVIISGTYVGSVAFYDSATVAGTAGTNLIYTAVLPGLNLNQSVEIHVYGRIGLVYAALGTPVLTFTWS